MTTPRGSIPRGETPRGRGLDALFEGATNPVGGGAEVDADLAALLDNEVRAAQGGVRSPDRSPLSGAGGRRAVETPETIDLPPAGPQAQPVQPTQPVEPPTQPAQPIQAAPPAQPTQPVQPAQPTQPVQPAQSTQPVQPAQPSQPAEATQPAGGFDFPAAEPERVLPRTKRIHAIVMEAEPAAAAAPPVEEPAVEVGPAGEIIEERPLPAVTPEKLPAERGIMPPGSGSSPTSWQPPPIVITPRPAEEKTLILARLDTLLGPDWQPKFRQEVDDLYKQVATEFSSPPEKANQAATLLNEALQTLVETPEEYVAAKNRIIQVQTMLSRTRESRAQSGHYGPRILGYQVGWMLLFLLGLIFAAPLAAWLGSLGKMSEKTMADLFPIWNTMMWGGIGGVIGALYTLWWHISDQEDFDRQYLMWYLVQPIMGLLLGGIVFLLLAGGLLILAVNLTDSTNATAGARLLPYLTAVLAGFRQNFIYEQFDRLIALFTPATQKQGGQTQSGQGQGGGAGAKG